MFIYGILISITLIFQGSIIIKTIQFVLFLFLCVFERQKISWLSHIALFFIIVLFNLLTFEGEALFVFLTIPVTSLALLNGIAKAMTLLALFFMSRCILMHVKIRHNKKRNMISQLNYCVNYFLVHMRNIRIRKMMTDLDNLLLGKHFKEKKKEKYGKKSSRKMDFKMFIYMSMLGINTIFLLIQ